LNILDLILFILIFVGFILGFKDGFIRKLIGLLGFGLAIYLAITFAYSFGRFIESITGIEIYLSEIIAGIIIFLLVILSFSLIKRFVHPFDKVNNFVNRLTGGLVGGIQIIFVLSAFLILLNIFNTPGKESRNNSFLYNKVYNIIPATIEYLSRYEAEPKKVIKDYIIDKDTLK
jgi:membrane protein required for colicin V production